MESKYRWRRSEGTSTGNLVPREYWDTPKNETAKRLQILGGKGFSVAKNDDDNQWYIMQRGDGRKENPDIADTLNTVLKMAKKRSFVDATITATGASHLFTQDIDGAEPDATHHTDKQESEKPAPKQERTEAKQAEDRGRPPLTAGTSSKPPQPSQEPQPESSADKPTRHPPEISEEIADAIEAGGVIADAYHALKSAFDHEPDPEAVGLVIGANAGTWMKDGDANEKRMLTQLLQAFREAVGLA